MRETRDTEITALRAELAAAKNRALIAEKQDERSRHLVRLWKDDREAQSKALSAMTAERDQLAAHDAAVKVAVLREVANKFETTEIDTETREPSESYDCGYKDGQYSAVNWLMAKADSIEKEAANG